MKKTAWLCGFIGLSVIFGICAVLIGNADTVFPDDSTMPAGAQSSVISPLIVIDPGHGGEDGGCSAADGTLEKDINLLQSQSLCDMLNAMGMPAVMTRTDDSMLYDRYGDLEDYTGRKKVYDLKNRIRFSSESGAVAMISIHMNKFPDGKYKGTQVYYSPDNDGSTQLADCIQNSVSKNLQKDNSRLIKKAGSNIYLLNRSEITSVLCECGFLSNQEETELLKDGEYREKLSLCIATAAMEWLLSHSEQTK